MSTSLQTFKIESLDLGSMTDLDLNKPSKPSYLRKPGAYRFKIVEAKLYATDKMKDGAGKQWGSILLKGAEVNSGKLVQSFVAVPLETLEHTSRNGKTSTAKSKIFARLAASLLDRQVTVAELPAIINNLGELLAEGREFTGVVAFTNDYVSHNGSNVVIRLVDGTELVDENGEALIFETGDAAAEYYASVKGRQPSRGMEYTTFRIGVPANVDSAAA